MHANPIYYSSELKEHQGSNIKDYLSVINLLKSNNYVISQGQNPTRT